MARQLRSTDDPPTRTPSFVCEVPLRVTPAQERVLLARLEAARQVYNACLGQARTRVRLVRESKAFQRARTLPRDDPARQARVEQIGELDPARRELAGRARVPVLLVHAGLRPGGLAPAATLTRFSWSLAES